MSGNVNVIDKRWILLVAVVVGILLVGTNMPPIGIDVSNFDMPSLGGSPEIPEIALNPPDEEDRDKLRDRLIQEGVPESNFGKIRAEVGNYILPEGDEEYLFDIDNIPQEIPISEWIVVENLRVEGERFKFSLRNIGSQEAEIPFILLNAVVIVEDNEGDLHRLDSRGLAKMEVSENNVLAPGEKIEIISINLFEVYKERKEEGIAGCIEIESVWIEFQSAKDVQALLKLESSFFGI